MFALLTMSAIVLVACDGQSSTQTTSPAPSSTSSSSSSVASAPATTIDCAHPGTQIATTVCGDPELSTLNQQVDIEFQSTLCAAGDKSAVESSQNDWVENRDECSTAADVRACVLQAYRTRLVELKIAKPGFPALSTNHYTCDDTSKQLTTVFYNDFQPPAAVLTWGSDKAILFQQMMGSGIRYTRDGVEYDEHQGSVQVDFHGAKINCTVA